MQQIDDFALDHLRSSWPASPPASRPIELAVGLRARALHRRALAPVQQAELDAGGVGGPAHDPVQRVDLAHQMAFAQAADRRIAATSRRCRRAPASPAPRARPSAPPHARPRVPAWPPPIDDHVEMFHVKHSSLADAEAGEDLVQQHFHIHPPDQARPAPAAPDGASSAAMLRPLRPRLYLIPRQFQSPQRRAAPRLRCRARLIVEAPATRPSSRRPISPISQPTPAPVRPEIPSGGASRACRPCPAAPDRPASAQAIGPSPSSSTRNTRRSAAAARCHRPVDADLLDRIVGLAQPGGIEQRHRQTAQIHPHLDHVPRRSRQRPK